MDAAYVKRISGLQEYGLCSSGLRVMEGQTYPTMNFEAHPNVAIRSRRRWYMEGKIKLSEHRLPLYLNALAKLDVFQLSQVFARWKRWVQKIVYFTKTGWKARLRSALMFWFRHTIKMLKCKRAEYLLVNSKRYWTALIINLVFNITFFFIVLLSYYYRIVIALLSHYYRIVIVLLSYYYRTIIVLLYYYRIIIVLLSLLSYYYLIIICYNHFTEYIWSTALLHGKVYSWELRYYKFVQPRAYRSCMLLLRRNQIHRRLGHVRTSILSAI